MDEILKKTHDRLSSRLWLGCLIGFSLLYLLTCQRGLSWQDSGWLQMRILCKDYLGTANSFGDLGIALSHPLFIYLGQIAKSIPIGSLFVRLNFLSGFAMAIALANIAWIITFLTKNRLAGILTVLMLSVAHTVWWLSTVTEVYTWSLAGFTVEIIILLHLLDKPKNIHVVLLALVSGLGLSMHNFALLPLPVYLFAVINLAVRRKISPWVFIPAFIAYLAGASFLLGLIIQEVLVTKDVISAVRSALVGKYAKEVASSSFNYRHIKANIVMICLNFMNILLPAIIVGLRKASKVTSRNVYYSLLAVGLIHLIFFVRYPVPDQFTFILPTLAMVAIFAGVGISWIMSISIAWRRAVVIAACVSIVFSVVFYQTLPSLIKKSGVNVQRRRTLPYRNEVRYWIVPWKFNENSAQRFATEALKQIEPDAVVMVDATSHNPLLLAQTMDKSRQDVVFQTLFGPLPTFDTDPVGFYLSTFDRPLYSVSFHESFISAKLMKNVDAKRPQGQLLYKLEWKKGCPFLTDQPINQTDKTVINNR